MNRISVLDCTLRDGGYCNQWKFGFDNEKKIVQSLIDADIDIIECGFITNRISYDKEYTMFSDFAQIAGIIPSDRRNKLFVAMINYGEYNLEDIPECDHMSVDGIRIAFHKDNYFKAMEYCRQVMEKGYLVFVQAMVSLSYSDSQFLELISLANKLMPYAFYIVDSFGMMKGKDLIRLFYMVEHNLDPNIFIGFHTHNNMQLSFSNAQTLVGIQTSRNLIIDSSIYGMGRGAGNLNTELFVEYLNDNINANYTLKPLLAVIDEILSFFHEENHWGYSLPNYLSAKYNTHPNYASYLDEKKTLTIENMDDIFSIMADSKRVSYDKTYIENLYEEYMASGEAQVSHLSEFRSRIWGKTVLIIAPGKSSFTQAEKIVEASNHENVITISINAEYPYRESDYIFLSNIRRYRELDKEKHSKCVATSNIQATDIYLKMKYSDFTNAYEAVRDNAGLMAIKLFYQLGAKKILIAGMDGYSVDIENNYADKTMEFFAEKALLETMNKGMCNFITEYSKLADIEFVTEPKYVRINT